MSKIDDDLPTSVLSALAKALGFQLSYDRAPDTDTWTLSAGHGDSHVEYVGTRKSVCAFLQGFGTMRLQTMSILNKIDMGHRTLIDDARDHLGR